MYVRPERDGNRLSPFYILREISENMVIGHFALRAWQQLGNSKLEWSIFKCKQTSDKRKLEFELKLYIQLFQRLGGPFRFQAVSEALGHDLLVCLGVSQRYILTWFISYHLFDWLTLLSRLLFLCGSKITSSTWYSSFTYKTSFSPVYFYFATWKYYLI